MISNYFAMAHAMLMSNARRWLATLAMLTLSVGNLSSAETSARSPEQLAAEVKEIFRRRCFECHGGSSNSGRHRDLAARCLARQTRSDPGKPDESKAYLSVIEADESARMPQGQPALSSQDINTLRQYLLAGAPAFPPPTPFRSVKPRVLPVEAW